MIHAEITKYFVHGILKGHTHTEVMPFASLRLAEDWFDGVNSQCKRGYCDYHVTEMKVVRDKRD